VLHLKHAAFSLLTCHYLARPMQPPACCALRPRSFDEFVRMSQDKIFLTGKLQEYRHAFE
jgi:hypothetical protein